MFLTKIRHFHRLMRFGDSDVFPFGYRPFFTVHPRLHHESLQFPLIKAFQEEVAEFHRTNYLQFCRPRLLLKVEHSAMETAVVRKLNVQA